MARVWEHSQHSGTSLLMLLALADFSDDDGMAFPAVEKLAKKCRMSKRNAQDRLKELATSGELTVLKNQGPPPKFPNLYRINLGALGVKPTAPVRSTSPVKCNAERDEAQRMTGVKHTAPKPPVNHQEPSERVRLLRGTRLPSDWRLPDEYREWAARELGWTTKRSEDIAVRFADYWNSATGRAASKADWFATWRNWCRNEKTPSSVGHSPVMTRYQQNQAAISASLFGTSKQAIGQPAERIIDGEVIQ